MKLLAIDPGPTESAFVVWDGVQILQHGKVPSGVLFHALPLEEISHCAIEMIASYGMPVGADVFETCVWIGRYIEQWQKFTGFRKDPLRIPRIEVKNHLCHSSKAKDSNIRQALIDRLGAPGKAKCPGITYGIAGDEWAALAVAVTVWDRLT